MIQVAKVAAQGVQQQFTAKNMTMCFLLMLYLHKDGYDVDIEHGWQLWP